MELTRDHVTKVLWVAGYEELAELVESSLPDPVELDEVAEFLQRHRVFHDDLIGRLGGSP
jgi:hypothetical protein